MFPKKPFKKLRPFKVVTDLLHPMLTKPTVFTYNTVSHLFMWISVFVKFLNWGLQTWRSIDLKITCHYLKTCQKAKLLHLQPCHNVKWRRREAVRCYLTLSSGPNQWCWAGEWSRPGPTECQAWSVDKNLQPGLWVWTKNTAGLTSSCAPSNEMHVHRGQWPNTHVHSIIRVYTDRRKKHNWDAGWNKLKRLRWQKRLMNKDNIWKLMDVKYFPRALPCWPPT